VSIIKLLPPCSYQGGKQRLANQICDIIEEREGSEFVFSEVKRDVNGSGGFAYTALLISYTNYLRHNTTIITQKPLTHKKIA
jgi:hypothetical protein